MENKLVDFKNYPEGFEEAANSLTFIENDQMRKELLLMFEMAFIKM